VAHKNIEDRRAAIRALIAQGVTPNPRQRKALAATFGCSKSAIDVDVAMIVDPFNWLGMRATFAAVTQRNRARKLGLNKHFTIKEWRALLLQCKGLCALCHNKAPLGPDHIIPLSHGGANSIDNIQPLCFSCNAHKHAKLP